ARAHPPAGLERSRRGLWRRLVYTCVRGARRRCAGRRGGEGLGGLAGGGIGGGIGGGGTLGCGERLRSLSDGETDLPFQHPLQVEQRLDLLVDAVELRLV